jgi:hypothetical protein
MHNNTHISFGYNGLKPMLSSYSILLIKSSYSLFEIFQNKRTRILFWILQFFEFCEIFQEKNSNLH